MNGHGDVGDIWWEHNTALGDIKPERRNGHVLAKIWQPPNNTFSSIERASVAYPLWVQEL